MSIVSSADLIDYLGVSSYDGNIQAIHEGIEAWIKTKTGQHWESTAFTNKLYDGNGSYKLCLDEIPIISVKYVGLDIASAVKVKNTLTDATLASVVIDATNITLTVEGGSGDGVDVLAKADNATITTLIASINALSAHGWSAEIVDSKFAKFKTAYMADQQIDCTNEDNAVNDWNYLNIIHNLARSLTLNKTLGIIYCDQGFPYGVQNIAITYTVGYTIPPSDICLFILDSCKALYKVKTTDTEGVSHYRMHDIEVWYSSGEAQKAGVTAPQNILDGRVKITL